MNEVLYTPSEVAEKLKVSRHLIYKWLKSGKIGAVKIGGQYRIRSSDLDAVLQ